MKILKFNSSGSVEILEIDKEEVTTIGTTQNETELPWSFTIISTNADNVTVQSTSEGVEVSSSTTLNNLTATGSDGWNSYSVESNSEINSITVATDSIKSSICLLADDSTIINAEKLKYTVYFDSQGGSMIDPIDNIDYEELINEPDMPEKAGYIFDGWYISEDLIELWDFSCDTITANTTIYAKWIGKPFFATLEEVIVTTDQIDATVNFVRNEVGCTLIVASYSDGKLVDIYKEQVDIEQESIKLSLKEISEVDKVAFYFIGEDWVLLMESLSWIL